jgi:transposase
METPQGKKRLTDGEIAIIRAYRLQGYSYSQISRFTNRSLSSIKRIAKTV